MITEINLVVKGSNQNRQTFTSEDIMTLKKEEERKSAPNKTGGVFNLLFRRGKSSNIQVTAPPLTKEPPPIRKEDLLPKPTTQPIIVQEPQKEKPKVPQRKRRPAPKPPQPPTDPQIKPPIKEKDPEEEPVQLRNASVISDESNSSDNGAKHETGVTICHSRHSSDSSGYHETSILSDQCNTSLPRRNRLTEVDTMGRLKLNRYSESTGNLTKMTSHSRSTSSLIFPGRKKKAAPPPPQPLQKPASSTMNLTSLSPVVASQPPLSSSSSKTDLSLASQGIQNTNNPPPIPRRRKGPTPTPQTTMNEEEEEEYNTEDSLYSCPYQTQPRETPETSRPPSNLSTIDILKSLEYLNLDDQGNEIRPPSIIAVLPKSNQTEDEEETPKDDLVLTKRPFVLNLVDKEIDDDNTSVATESPVKNELNSLISEVSSVDLPKKKYYHKEFSVSSVKSSESALFEEGQMRRWGSWDRLNLSSFTSSVIDEIPRYSSEENLKEIEGKTTTKSSPHIEEKSSQTEEETKSLGLKENFTICQQESIEDKTNKQELTKETEIEDNTSGVFSKADISSTSSHKISLPTEKQFPILPTDSTIEEKDIALPTTLYTTDVINEISLDDVERYKNYENSPDSGNSSEISEKSKIDDEPASPETIDVANEVIEEWQLPSPPKAFKDTFPNSQTIETCEIDSVITPELIEKLERIEKQQSQNITQSNVLYEDNELILNKLSLENLEKRKSLVYNRELATSLKSSYEEQAKKEVVTEPKPPKTIEKTPEEPRTMKREEKTIEAKESTLPNFKITTYEEPKQVKVFEDDTIRSNSDFSGKSLSLNRGLGLPKNMFGTSMENVSVRKNEDVEHRIFRPKSDHYRRPVNRSGSFSVEHNEWSSSRPVMRSKSQVALRRGERKLNGLEGSSMSRSSSLFDVSGLQSLEVIKKIQNKLNTPTTSMETLTKIESEKKVETKSKPPEVEEPPRRKYQYTGPPSINMGTWSERPKVPVSVKEDADYKLGLGTNKKYHQNGSHTLDTKPRYTNGVNSKPNEPQRVTITCNGTSENHRDFNVLIKIEDQNRRSELNDSYKTSYSLNHRSTQRPHSVAFPSDFDISRVPVVRSVELKKNFRQIPNNTSVIHLNQSNESYYTNGFTEKREDLKTSETNRDVSKPVLRAKSFLQAAPVVRGFRTLENKTTTPTENANKTETFNRYSWQPTTSMTLPSQPKKDSFTTNQNVPFSRFNLRRTESKNARDDWDVPERNQTNPTVSKPPVDVPQPQNSIVKPSIPKPPPQMPKFVQKKITNRQFVPVLDPRDELLKSIRDFGGKKGLRSRKA